MKNPDKIDITSVDSIMQTLRSTFFDGILDEDDEGQIIIHTGLYQVGDSSTPLMDKLTFCGKDSQVSWSDEPISSTCPECEGKGYMVVCQEEGIKQQCPICEDFENFMEWREVHQKSNLMKKQYVSIMEKAIETLGGWPSLGELIKHLKKEGYLA